MHETVELPIRYWKSVIVKSAPWAILVGLFQVVLRDTSTTTVEANSAAFEESAALVAQDNMLLELLVPLLFLIVFISLTMPLHHRV